MMRYRLGAGGPREWGSSPERGLRIEFELDSINYVTNN